jgi:hypothetical protein
MSPGPTRVPTRTMPALVEVRQRALADVGMSRVKLLAAELGLADLDVVLLDVDRGERVVLDQPLVMTIASSKL